MVLVNSWRYPDPYKWFPDTDPDPDPTKWYGSGSETLLNLFIFYRKIFVCLYWSTIYLFCLYFIARYYISLLDFSARNLFVYILQQDICLCIFYSKIFVNLYSSARYLFINILQQDICLFIFYSKIFFIYIHSSARYLFVYILPWYYRM